MMGTRDCNTCLYEDVLAGDDPCYTCTRAPNYSNWRAGKECDEPTSKETLRATNNQQTELIEELLAKNERLNRFVKDCGTTMWPCPTCGNAMSTRHGCLWCKLHDAQYRIAELESAAREHEEKFVCCERIDPAIPPTSDGEWIVEDITGNYRLAYWNGSDWISHYPVRWRIELPKPTDLPPTKE